MNIDADWIEVSHEEEGWCLYINRAVSKHTFHAMLDFSLSIHICEDRSYQMIGTFYEVLDELGLSIDWDNRLKLMEKVGREESLVLMQQLTEGEYYE